MIVPLLLGLKDFLSAPITWTLVLMNLAFYFVTLDARQATSGPDFFDARNVQRTGVYYLQYLGEKDLPTAHDLVLWGGKGMRDPGFMSTALEFPFKGDDQEILAWRTGVERFQTAGRERPSMLFGLSRDPNVAWQKPLTFITYQFMHASAMHILSNLVFLLLFGIAVEKLAGSVLVTLLFLGGGVFGAAFALWTDPPSALPMVGASASVSAMMAFYLVAEKKRNIRFFYFFSPFKGFFGDVYLSKWWILPVCFLPDVANWISDQLLAESRLSLMSQSVATSAHIGGAMFGVCVAAVSPALLKFLLRFLRPEQNPGEQCSRSRLGDP